MPFWNKTDFEFLALTPLFTSSIYITNTFQLHNSKSDRTIHKQTFINTKSNTIPFTLQPLNTEARPCLVRNTRMHVCPLPCTYSVASVTRVRVTAKLEYACSLQLYIVANV